MNLDPSVSPWIGVFASTGICLWMAAIGAPLARAVFGDRPRPVWPFYAPALGIVAVLLTTNLSAYVIARRAQCLVRPPGPISTRRVRRLARPPESVSPPSAPHWRR